MNNRPLQQKPYGIKDEYFNNLLNLIDNEEKFDDQSIVFLNRIASNFLDQVIGESAIIAKKRGSDKIEPKDIHYILQSSFNITLPGAINRTELNQDQFKPTSDYLDKLKSVKELLAKQNSE